MASTSAAKQTPIFLSSATKEHDDGAVTTTTNNATLPFQSQADTYLFASSHLTRQELLRRRLTRARNLSKIYRHHYWALMEHLRSRYREYYWTYGISPVASAQNPNAPDADPNIAAPEGCGENNNINLQGNGGGIVSNNCGGGKLGLEFGESNTCTSVSADGFHRCKLKAMAMTNFCHFHILSDPNQKLYKPCSFVIKAPQQGQILCGKPVLRSAVPSLCKIHLPKYLKEVKHALKKAGLTATSSGRLAPMFHAVVAEYVHLIQSKRREIQKDIKKNNVIKGELSN